MLERPEKMAGSKGCPTATEQLLPPPCKE